MVMGPVVTPVTCIDCTSELNQVFDTVIVGDADGHIMMVRLSVNNLTYKNCIKDPNCDSRYIMQLQYFLKFWTKRKIHDSSVLKVGIVYILILNYTRFELKVRYITELKSFISCCGNSKNSLAFEDVYKFQFKETRYTLKLFVLFFYDF